MNHKNIMACAVLIFALSHLFRTLQPAHAFPQGPNVDLGSNPLTNFYGVASSSTAITLQNNFILTTLMSSNTGCNPKLDGTVFHTGTGSENMFYYRYAYFHPSPFTAGTAKLHIASGSTLTLSNCSNYYIEGYYTH